MFNRIVFFWKIGCIGALLGCVNWFMYHQGLPFLSSWWTLLPFLLLPFSFSLAYNAIHAVPSWLEKIFAWTGGYWFVFTLYSFFFALLYGLAFLLCALSRSLSLWHLYAPLAAQVLFVLCLLLLCYGSWHALHPVTRTVTVQTDKLTAPVTLAFLTDLHLGPLQSNWYSRRLVKRINDLSADAVILGGDLIDAHLDFVLRDGSYRAFEQIKARLGTYAVFGNHDFFDGDIDREDQYFSSIRFLRHEQWELVPGLVLTGLNDYIHFPSAPVPACDPGQFNILIDHEPLRISQAEAAGYDLYLGGHTHAGQFFPVTAITNRLYQLNYGSRYFGKLLAIVSSGYGSWGMPFRTGPAPEIVVIKIKGRP